MKDEQTPQDRLDRAARRLWAVKRDAEAGAIELCEKGDFEAAAVLHEIAGLVQIAYGKGRALTLANGGIQPRGGGK